MYEKIIKTSNLESTVLENLKEAHINLCMGCGYTYPECPSESQDALFGNYDNICACAKFKPCVSRGMMPEPSKARRAGLMDDELIEQLRTHARDYEEMFGEGESSVMMREAADAIEKLWNEVKAHRMRYGWVDSEDGGQDDV